MVPRQSALDDQKTAEFAQISGELIIWYGPDRRVVMYPCSDNTMLNFVCIHPRDESEAKTDGVFFSLLQDVLHETLLTQV